MRTIGTLACGLLATILSGTAFADKAVEDGVVRIAILTDLSGLYSDLAGQGAVIAAEMAIEDAGGSMLGKPIELYAEDHKNDGKLALELAEKLHKTNKVDAIGELVSSGTALPVNKYSRENQIVTLINGAASSSLTGAECSPWGIHWAYDTYSLAIGTGQAVVKEGGDTWFFVTADYSFGHTLQKDVSEVVQANGGKVLGAALAPFKGTDFAPYVLQAQVSGAKIVGLANAGRDNRESIKAAYELGVVSGGQKLAGLLMFITDVRQLGLYVANGLQLTTGFYWDLDDDTRAWSRKFNERHGAMPTMIQAGTYSSVAHYLKGVKAANTDNADAVVKKMQELPVNDFFGKGGQVRKDGRMVHSMYLVEVKKPSESKGAWDYLKLVREIPGNEAFRPITGECPTAPAES